MASKLAALLLAAGPARISQAPAKKGGKEATPAAAGDEEDLNDGGADEGDEGEGDGAHIAMDPDEMTAMMKEGCGYGAHSGTGKEHAVKPNMAHPDLKDPNHPFVKGMQAFAKAHDEAAAAHSKMSRKA